MKKKLLWILVALALTLSPFGASLAQARYPELRGTVTDDANVLSKEIMAEIAEFQTLIYPETDVRIHVALVHFLDGVDAQTYANALFSRWALGENDFLLLGAAGEDVFASASGKKLKEKFTDSSAQSLLFTSGFADSFKSQRYDEAFGQYWVAFSQMLNKQYDADIYLGKLFAQHRSGEDTAAPGKPAIPDRPDFPFASDVWENINERFADHARDYEESSRRREENSQESAPKAWIVLAVLALLLFSRKTTVYKNRKKGGCLGCLMIPITLGLTLAFLNFFLQSLAWFLW